MKVFKTTSEAIMQINQDINLDCVKKYMIQEIKRTSITKSIDTIYVVDEYDLLKY